MVKSGLSPSRLGPTVPEFATKTLMKPSALVMCSTILERSSLDVTSPFKGIILPCFWVLLQSCSMLILSVRRALTYCFLRSLLQHFYSSTNDIDFRPIFLECFGHHQANSYADVKQVQSGICDVYQFHLLSPLLLDPWHWIDFLLQSTTYFFGEGVWNDIGEAVSKKL